MSRALEVVVLVEFEDGSDEGLQGVYGLALMVFLLKLNVLEIVGKGAWERPST